MNGGRWRINAESFHIRSFKYCRRIYVENTREYLQFLYIALGSLGELDTQLEIAKRLSYVRDTEKFNIDITLVRKQLYSLINTVKLRLK